MPTDKLFPAFVKIEYVSVYSPHTMTRPTLNIVTTGLGDAGTCETHDAVGIATDVMVEAFIDLLLPMFLATTTIVGYTCYQVPFIGADPQPFFGKSYGGVGTASPTAAGQTKASTTTLMYRTTNFGLARLILVERPSYGENGKNTLPLSGDYAALNAEYTSVSNGWAGQDNGRPGQYLWRITRINDKLRRKYGGIL